MALQSYFSLMLLSLIKRIAEKVPEIIWIDQDFGQLEHYDERPPVSFPCVLIDFNTTTYDQESQQEQIGNPNINFRLGFAPWSQSSNTAPQAVQEKALYFWELELKLYQALQGWNPVGDICQPLTRVSATTERREDPLRVRSLIFTTAFEDDTATPKYTKVPRPRLEEEFYKEL